MHDVCGMKRHPALALALALALVGACAHQQVTTSGRLAPSLVVEQFMRAANGKDLDTMARLFGTKDGSAADHWGRDELEKRMFIYATELRHNDYEIVSEEMVPGRTDVATRLNVQLTRDDGKFLVPFTLVRYKGDTWLIEQFGLDVLTGTKKSR